MQRSRDKLFKAFVLSVVAVNYLAQIPYYLHLYYPHPLPLIGSSLLGATLVWFLWGYLLFAKATRLGYWLLISYLVVMVAFYLHSTITHIVGGLNPLFFLRDRDPLVGVVLAIGYVNMLAGIYFISFLLRHRDILVDTSRESA